MTPMWTAPIVLRSFDVHRVARRVDRRSPARLSALMSPLHEVDHVELRVLTIADELVTPAGHSRTRFRSSSSPRSSTLVELPASISMSLNERCPCRVEPLFDPQLSDASLARLQENPRFASLQDTTTTRRMISDPCAPWSDPEAAILQSRLRSNPTGDSAGSWSSSAPALGSSRADAAFHQSRADTFHPMT